MVLMKFIGIGIVILSFLASAIMAYKSYKKRDISIVGAVLARLYLAFITLSYLVTPSQDKATGIHIGVAIILASDIIINLLYFSLKKHVSQIEYNKTLNAFNSLSDKFITVVETAPVSIYSYDFSGIIEYVNEKLLNTLNYTKDEMIGKSIFNFLEDRDIPTVKYYLQEKITGRIKTASYEAKILNKRGQYVKVEITGSKTENGHPTITGMMIFK